MKAIWNDQVLAESDNTVVVESNHYFPASGLNKEHFKASEARTVCPWKGEAHYYDVIVHGNTNKEAAWFYPETKEKAKHIEGMVAFWHGVKVIE